MTFKCGGHTHRQILIQTACSCATHPSPSPEQVQKGVSTAHLFRTNSTHHRNCHPQMDEPLKTVQAHKRDLTVTLVGVHPVASPLRRSRKEVRVCTFARSAREGRVEVTEDPGETRASASTAERKTRRRGPRRAAVGSRPDFRPPSAVGCAPLVLGAHGRGLGSVAVRMKEQVASRDLRTCADWSVDSQGDEYSR